MRLSTRKYPLDNVILLIICVVAGAIFLRTHTHVHHGRGLTGRNKDHCLGRMFFTSAQNHLNDTSGGKRLLERKEDKVDEVVSSAVSSRRLPAPARYAYAFYVAEDAYACGALVNMARLRRSGLPPDVDLVMIAHDTVSVKYQQVAQEEFGALIYGTSSFGGDAAMQNPVGSHAGYYRHCFQKLMVFLLPQDVYRRVILMDADSLILRPPHHLLHLPEELPFALPQGYWLLPNEDKLTSWFMSVRPSKDTYDTLMRRLNEFIQQGQIDIYDMDLFNLVYKNETTVLPDIYGLLDSEFEENHHDHVGNLDDILQGKRGWAVHFTAGGKPWTRPRDEAGLRNFRPGAHPGYAQLTLTWQQEADAVCPR